MGRRYFWQSFTDDELLELRFSDLNLQLRDVELIQAVALLHGELEKKDITMKPHVWLSDDWFSPDGISGFAIPFYVAHPRLARLERRQIGEVEGGNPKWLKQLLRHECGHAIENAFGFRRRRKRQQLFGKTSEPYRDYYVPKPHSKKCVVHLEDWYSQSHPDEDFAETFAVWLTPRSNWKKRYLGWSALKKLEYMDELMGEIKGKRAPYLNRRVESPLREMKMTLGRYYAKKRARLGLIPGQSRLRGIPR